MVDLLPPIRPTVHDQTVAGVGHAFRARDVARDPDHTAQGRLVLRGHVVDGGDDVVGDDEHMGGGLRIDVAKGRHEVVLIHDVRGDLTADDLGEDGLFCHD